jgi:hypothetical protein
VLGREAGPAGGRGGGGGGAVHEEGRVGLAARLRKKAKNWGAGYGGDVGRVDRQ